MDLSHLPNLAAYTTHRLADPAVDSEEQALIENFLLDERPPVDGMALYSRRLGSSAILELDDWQDGHKNFTSEEIRISMTESGQPWTFCPENDVNRLRLIDPRIYLVRVERASWPCSLAGVEAEKLRYHIDEYQRGVRGASEAFLERVASIWNTDRDKRPLFATTELEVEDIISDGNPNWAERLRDHLGLGHYSPGSASGPIEVILMRYTVQEVLDSLAGAGYPAIPTVLDGDMNHYFYPSPIPTDKAENPYYGHTVNLTPVSVENDYAMGAELLHPRIDYKPDHFFKFGVIANPVTMDIGRARSFHLPWIRLYSGRDDFGAGVVRSTP